MKTRDQIYKEDGAVLLRLLTNYHALRYEQILQLFPRNHDSLKSFITSLTKQGRIYHDKEKGLLCDTPDSANSPDYGTIAAFWILLDFKKAIIYHTSGEFPIKLHFFANDEVYEIIHVPIGQEILINHVCNTFPPSDSKRLVLLESEHQANKISIPGVIAFCLVDSDGKVSYYQKK